MPTDRVRKLGSAYFAMQGVLCIAWWIGLLAQPARQTYFLPERFGPDFASSLIIADLGLVGVFSLLVAVGWLCGRTWMHAATWLLCGSVAYAFLLALGSWWRTGQAMLGALAMIPPLVLTFAFAFALARSTSERPS